MRRVVFIIAIFLLGFESSQLFNYFLSQKNIVQLPRIAEISHEATNTAVLGKRASEEYARVIRVIDGDTIEIEGGRRVRYIGIDTPETVDPRKPVECFGREAAGENRRLVEGKEVRLEKDISDTDRYGRLLRYVSINNQMINDVLVRQGFAHASSYPPDIKYQEQLRDAQREARENGRGLWAGCITSAPLTIQQLLRY
ncbi:thermonuclease family protein [Candidatus Gottesmanbacteria bacterium]|nr:thermonuclease family protein [Candidatus Gottesmanbacteria bacterium]